VSYDEAVAWLYSTQLHGIKLGLENIQRLGAALGIRLSGVGAPMFLHVAGTNGKGSTCAMLDAICRAAALRTGLFTSPHLITFRERLRVNGEMISEEEVVEGLTTIRSLIADWEHSPTFFEITTALALAWFQKCQPHVVILETGMGGRLDATNIVIPTVSIITPIAFDHQQWLGSTLPEIAAEKAGIIKPRVPVVCAPQPDEALCVLSHIAFERGAAFHLVESSLVWPPVNLAGQHQRWNAAVAVRALEVAGLQIDGREIARGLREVQWPGRFQRIGERVVVDGAHNPAAMRQLARTWSELYRGEKATVIIGILKDKDLGGICAALQPIAARVFAVPVQSLRTRNAEEVACMFREVDAALPCNAATGLVTAIECALRERERVLITGSLFLVGEAIAHLEGRQLFEKSAQ
jgi:dihydrofolate synthase/folylpolyglutamate synthase